MKLLCADRKLPLGVEPTAGSASFLLENSDISSCAVRADNVLINSGKHFYKPEWITSLYYTPALLLRLNKVAKHVDPKFVMRYVEQGMLAVLLSGEVVSGVLTEFGYNFDSSVVMSKEGWQDIKDVLEDIPSKRIYKVADRVRDTQLMPYPFTAPSLGVIADYVSLLSRYFLLKIGDVIALPLWSYYHRIEQGDDIIMGGEQLDDAELVYFGVR